MIRILIYIMVIVALAALLTWMLSLDGGVQARFGPYVFDGTVSGILIALFILMGLASLFTWSASYFMRLPDKLRQRRREGQRTRGMVALARGLEAVSAGDADDAQRHAKAAERQLDEPALTRLLTAQAAQLAGDEATAERSFSAMLEAPETEFLGLRGLYLQALSIGNTQAAKLYADRAFKLRPNAKWAYEAAFDLALDRGSWSEAVSAIHLARKNNLIETDEAARKEAVLLTAQAYGAETAGDVPAALKDAHGALKLSPGFAPAATLAARLETGFDQRGKAARILEAAWMEMPHPAIAQSYANLYKEHPDVKRAAKLMKLADKAPERDESRQLRAAQHIALEEFTEAKTILEDLVTRKPTARTFAAMAKAIEGLYGEEPAKAWLDRAAAAPLEPLPGVDGTFHFTTDGWRRLVREYGEHGRLAPPPLENVTNALSTEEVRLLTAPPAKPEPEPAQELKVEAEPAPDAEPQAETAESGEAGEAAGHDAVSTAEEETTPPPQVIITGDQKSAS